MPYLDSYIDPSLNPDDLIRKRNLMMGFPNITGFDQPLDQAPSEPTPWYLAQNQPTGQKPGESPVQQPAPQVQGTGGQAPPIQTPPAQANAAAMSPYAEDPYKLAAEAKQRMATGYDPTQDLQSAAQDIRETRSAMPPVGPTSPLGQSAAAYQNVGRRPTAYDVDPTTGKEKYPVNKLEKVLLSPFMFKQMIHDPLGTREKMDLLTRKGYGQAEQQFYDTLEQRKRDFDINTVTTNQIMKTLTERLSADNSLVGISKSLYDTNRDISMMPLNAQAIATSMASQQANTVREGAPKYDQNNLFMAYVKDPATGKMRQTLVYPKTFPDGRPPEYYEPGKEGAIKDFQIASKFDASALGERERLILDREGAYVATHGDRPQGKDLTDLIQGVDRDLELPREEMQIKVAEEHAQIQALKDAKQKYAIDTRKARQMVDSQLINLQGLQTTLGQAMDNKNKNSVAGMMGVVEFATTLSSPGQRMTRYQSKEIGDIIKAPGRLQAIGAAVSNWMDRGAPIPPQVLEDIRRLSAAQMHDFKIRQDIYNTADQALATAKTPLEVADIQQQRDDAIQEAFAPDAAMETPEQEKARLEQIQKNREKRKKESLTGK